MPKRTKAPLPRYRALACMRQKVDRSYMGLRAEIRDGEKQKNPPWRQRPQPGGPPPRF